MTDIVRAVDVGYGLTKYVTSATDSHINCAHFPSVAPLGGQPEAAATLGAKRRTITIPVGNLLYEVGPDIHLADDITKSAHLHDAYCTTDEYLALLRGAVRYMKLDRITLLVVGLPVSACRLCRAALERRSTGTHDLGRGRRVTIVDRLLRDFPSPLESLFGLARATASAVPGHLGEVSRAQSRRK
jgi:plasmid segregation protein ParM